MFLTQPRNSTKGEADPDHPGAGGPPWAPGKPSDAGGLKAAPRGNGTYATRELGGGKRPGWRARLVAALSADVSSATHEVVLRYGAAVLSVFIAATVTFELLRPVFSRNPFPLFYAAVIFAAWYGGIGASLVATGLSVWAIDYLFLPSLLRFDNLWHDVAQVGSFVFIAGLVGWLEARRRHAMGALESAKTAAESANRAKDDFLAVLSHELRTPLTPALAAAGVLAGDRSLPPIVRDDLGMIRRNIELEARLIDDLLDLTRITRGKLQINPRPVEVHQLIRSVLDICRREADDKRLNVRTALCRDRAWVVADPARLHQVLWNVVKNAVKFTPAGGTVTVRTVQPTGDDLAAAAYSASGGDPLFVIEVIDTGIGIGPDVLPRIFNAFEQGDRRRSHQFGGLGLGLAISRALVEAQGGELTAASEGPGGGSTFILRLPSSPEPVAKEEASPEPPDIQASEPPGGQPTTAPARSPVVTPPVMAGALAASRVLLVEDHADTARMIGRLLRGCGCDVRTARNMNEAVAAAAAAPFDLLVSDLGLPDGTGLDLPARFRQDHPAYRFRAIALSGYGMEDDLRRSREAGFAVHLTKPVSVDAVESAVRRLTSGAAA
jgi:signal transduction histidine kinase/CheY-like chemotaxis protein